MKKNLLAAAAVGAVAMLGLTACTAADDVDASASPSVDAEADATTDAGIAEPTADDLANLEAIEWSQEGEDAPTLDFEGPLTMTTSATRLIEDGDGDAITTGQIVTLDYVVFSGVDGESVYSTYESGAPESVTLEEGSVDPVLIEVLDGANVGVNFLYGAPDVSASDGSAIFMAVTATKATTPLERAEGEAVESAEGLPVITLAEDGTPSISFDEAGDMPEELVVQPLIKGDGEEVAEGASVTVHYTGWLWDGEQFDSSWDRGTPASFSLNGVIQGWGQGLAGQTVGSQVLLVIPPDLAYGEQESGSIPANSTLVFVVDILSAN
ncbi:FKBP-type peptidyl-prolyl cis-trans isomerase [Demequina pelophila]|uniref:FKBP-type peptidyl-prolyl cis-trans isomerase n=1 Tax=Demequina pelophila TaxID=1638984 RepID=UPI00078436C0|nr:FKBP-type peptidyl-prolyl cis-trans isomerase [Demequina pelophila]